MADDKTGPTVHRKWKIFVYANSFPPRCFSDSLVKPPSVCLGRFHHEYYLQMFCFVMFNLQQFAGSKIFYAFTVNILVFIYVQVDCTLLKKKS